MKTYLLSYLFTFASFLLIDLLWLGVIAKPIYQKLLGNFLSSQVNWPAAMIFYAFYVVGIFIFAVVPAAEKNSVSQSLITGALFGFFAYMTYELTNYSTMNGWPWQIVVIDIIWGAVLTSIVALIGYYFFNLFS